MSQRAASRNRSCVAAIALVIAFSAAMPADAGGLGDQLRKLFGRKADQQATAPLGVGANRGQSGPLTLDAAVAIVRALHPKAEVVGAVTRETPHGSVHEVKVLTPKGQVKVFRFDAQTGASLD